MNHISCIEKYLDFFVYVVNWTGFFVGGRKSNGGRERWKGAYYACAHSWKGRSLNLES